MRIAITGAGGLIGRRLSTSLAARGHSVAMLRRRPSPSAGDCDWEDPRTALEGADAVIHLAGEPVAQRWTPAAKERIRGSRVTGTRRLVEVMAALVRPPRVFVCASAIGIYGSRGDETLTEASSPGEGFLASVCMDWEREARGAERLGARVVSLRTGIVLDARGGALRRMLPAFRLGLGGRLGSGRQWMSWIHIEDLAGLLRHAIDSPDLHGPVNATAPDPATNAAFTAELAAALSRPAVFPVPEFALRLMFGEMSEVLLGSLRVIPAAAEASGFRFRFPRLPEALRRELSG